MLYHLQYALAGKSFWNNIKSVMLHFLEFKLIPVAKINFLHDPIEGRNQLFISGGGNFHEISSDDVMVLIRPWHNFFANGHI